jgi:branched-chain amino acid transport system substrate-binding protein
MSRLRAAIGMIAATLLLSACVADPMVVPTASPRPSPPAASGDGVLRIGTLLPTTGELAFLSPAQVAGVELAVREINEAGGVLDAPVEVFHRNSGDADTTTIETSYAELVERGVDVIIGPASSVLAERILPLAVADGIAVISPSATAAVLSALDDDGLLLRTAPSAALQGRAIATVLAEEGVDSIAAVAFDDANSAAISASLLDAAGTDAVTVDETFTAESDVAALVTSITEGSPQAVVVSSPFSASATTAALLTALAEAGLGGDALWLTSGNLADYSQLVPAGALEGARGLLDGRVADEDFTARVRSMDPGLVDVRYAAEAYDAAILAALATITSGDDGGPSIAYSALDVSAGGIKCMSLGECLEVLESRDDIDFDGISGPLGLDQRGDPSSAVYLLHTYGADNRPVPSEDILAG